VLNKTGDLSEEKSPKMGAELPPTEEQPEKTAKHNDTAVKIKAALMIVPIIELNLQTDIDIPPDK
jgi:hypothetical protein